MGPPAPTAFLDGLGRRPAEHRAEVLGSLHENAGNRRVSRMIEQHAGRRGVARVGVMPPVQSQEELVRKAVQSKDVGDIKAITNFSSATNPERIEFIGILLNQGWVGPMDEYALERLWNSFGTGIAGVAKDNPGLWKKCVDRGLDPSNVPAVDNLRKGWEADVRALAKAYMQENLKFADGELERLGLRAPAAGAAQSPTAATEQALNLEETQELARGAEALLSAKDRMRQLHVGYNMVMHPSAGGARVSVTFDPEPGKRPAYREAASFQTTMPPAPRTWDEVKAQWDAADAALAGITAKSPTVFAALAQGRETVKDLGQQNPQQAKATAQRVLTTLRTNIQATLPKVDSGDLDWRDLKPIHEQLWGGRKKGPSGTDWSNEFAKEVAKDVIGDHESTEFWIGLGLGTAAAALFIVASVASGGLATAALLGGIAASGGQAVRSWENYEDLATAAAGTASEETRLVSQGQVDAAKIQAIVDTIFAFLDIAAPLVKAGRAAMAAAELEKLIAERGVGTALEQGIRGGAAQGADAVRLIEQGVTELGVQGTVNRTGKSVDDLLKLVPADSPVAARLREAKELGVKGAAEAAQAGAEAGTKAGAGAAGEAAQAGAQAEARVASSAAANAAEEAWKAGRSLPELLADIPAAVALGAKSGGTKGISKEFAERLVSEAIEKLGPAETLKRAGGWKKLAASLGAESAAGKKFMAWRDAVFKDLEDYVVNQLGGKVQRTGTVKDFSNDIDMSFIGPNASEVKAAASEYLAKRLGVDNSPGAFDGIMMAGLFTDPRRMHAYDALPAAVRDKVAAKQAAQEEQLIWNRRLWEATQEGTPEMAKEVRDQMKALGIPEFAYKPLNSSDIARLSKRIDGLHGELEQAIAKGDAAAQERLAAQIGEAQAMINAAESGGYFSAGGVRRYVSERPGEKGFPRLPGGEGAAVASAEKLTAIVDQLPKLDHSALLLGGTGDEVIAGIRGVGKYGKRLAEVTGEAGVHSDSVWESLVNRCGKLKAAADEKALTMTAEEAQTLAREAQSVFGELTAKSAETMAQVRQAASLPQIANAAERLQLMITAHTKLLRSVDWLQRNIHVWARLLQSRSPGEAAPAPGPAPAPAPAAGPPAAPIPAGAPPGG
jgi:hypothetical protein